MVRRWRFSYAEVLVVLLASLFAGGLVVTGIVRMRETANLTTCQYKLKLLGTGVAIYHQSSARLPPLTSQGAGGSGMDLRSLFSTLRPTLESCVSRYQPGDSGPEAYHGHSSVSFSSSGKYPDGAYVQYGGDANQCWLTFIDPEDATAQHLRDVLVALPDGSGGYYATGSYAGNGLLPWARRSEVKESVSWPRGVVLFAERPQVCRTATGEEVHNLWGVGFYSPNMPSFATLTPSEPAGLWSTGQVAPDVAQVIGSRGADPREMRVRVGRTDALLQPADFSTPFQMLRGGQPCDPRRPATQHRGGMPTAMSDGSVRVFAPKVDPWVFWAACVLDDSRDGK